MSVANNPKPYNTHPLTPMYTLFTAYLHPIFTLLHPIYTLFTPYLHPVYTLSPTVLRATPAPAPPDDVLSPEPPRADDIRPVLTADKSPSGV